MKKFTSIILLMALVFSMSVVGFAASDDDEEDVILPTIEKFEVDQSENYPGGYIKIGAYMKSNSDDPAFWIDTVFLNKDTGKGITVRLLRNGDEDLEYDFAAHIKADKSLADGNYILTRAVIGDNDGNREVYTGAGYTEDFPYQRHNLPNVISFTVGYDVSIPKMTACRVKKDDKGRFFVLTKTNMKVDSVTLLFTNPENNHRISVTLGEDEREDDYTYFRELPVSKYEPTGMFGLKTIITKDMNNESYTFTKDPDDDQYPLNVEYSFRTQASAVDTIPPYVKSIKKINQKTTKSKDDVDEEITFRLVAGDNMSGIKHVIVKFRNPVTDESCNIVFRQDNFIKNGIYEATLKLDNEEKKGTWKTERITAVDNAGNRQIYTTKEDLKDERLLLPENVEFKVA